MRTCSKTACRWPAAASLSYRYDTKQVWLLDLAEQPDPSLYDLCPHHADNLVVMRGWDRVDLRTPPEPVIEPAGRDLLPESGSPPVGPRGYGGNRYQALVDDLPRVAASLADDLAEPEPESEPEPAPAARPAATPTRDRVEVSVVPSRDLAPLPPLAAPTATASSAPPAHDDSSYTDDGAEDDRAVVVPFTLAGRHRSVED